MRPKELPGPQRRAHLAMIVHHALMITCGLVGLAIDPSPSVIRVFGGGPLGGIVTALWSVFFLVAGGVSLVARALRSVRVEITGVRMIIGTRIVWSAIIVLALFVDRPPRAGGPIQYGSIQTALCILGGACALFAWDQWATSYLRTGLAAPMTKAEELAYATEVLRRYADRTGGSSTTQET